MKIGERRILVKNVEKFAIVAIVLLILSTVPSPLFNVIIAKLYDRPELAQYNILTYMMAMGTAFSRSLVGIGVGIWLFILARRENATPWIWLLLGLVFGLMAVVLFFLMKVYESVRPADSMEQAQAKG